MNFFCLIAFAAVLGSLLFTLDDLWIDLCAFIYDIKPQRLSDADLQCMRELPQKRIAIMVANWREYEILERMITGNLGRIDYRNYSFFLGIYPNDHETWQLARRLEQRFENVFVVVNSRQGPTTKGQMLNEIVRSILASEIVTGIQHEIFLMQDSEDVLHPLALQLINNAAVESDFIQTPVFSFDVPFTSWTRGTYLEEFSESHTKDLLVRQRLGAAIPSAGVGTALSRALVLKYLEIGDGSLLREDTLTEDYDLGLRTKALGLTSRFVCAYIENSSGERDFISTREYFPAQIRTSIRQKTRWTLGIAFQGRDNLGWSGDLVDRYFMFRDRRGPLNSVMMILGVSTLGGFSLAAIGLFHLPPSLRGATFVTLASCNGVNMVIRVVQRARCVARVHHIRHVFAVPIRWPVGMFVNGMAAVNAYITYRQSKRTGRAPRWEKTAHELPAMFGATHPARQPNARPLTHQTAAQMEQ